MFELFFRPHDLITGLKPLHLPMVFAILCLGVHLFNCMSNGHPLFRLTTVTKMLALLSFWALAGVPFAYWSAGALSTFIFDWSKMLVLFLLLANGLSSLKQVKVIVW